MIIWTPKNVRQSMYQKWKQLIEIFYGIVQFWYEYLRISINIGKTENLGFYLSWLLFVGKRMHVRSSKRTLSISLGCSYFLPHNWAWINEKVSKCARRFMAVSLSGRLWPMLYPNYGVPWFCIGHVDLELCTIQCYSENGNGNSERLFYNPKNYWS